MATDNKSAESTDPGVKTMVDLANLLEKDETRVAEEILGVSQTEIPDEPKEPEAPELELEQPEATSSPEIVEPDEPAKAEESQEAEAPEFTGVDPEPEPEALEEPEAEPAPVIAAPAGMTDDDKAHFAELTPEAQRFLVEQEALRTADYQRKTLEAAEQRKQAEQLKSQYAETLQQQQQVLEQYAASYQEIPMPDISLAQTNVEEYVQQLAVYNAQKQDGEKAVREYERIQAEKDRLARERQEEFVQAEAAKLVQMEPEFAVPEKGQELAQKVGRYAMDNVGLSQHQLEALTAQEIQTIYKAYKLDTATTVPKKAVKPKKAAPKSVKSKAPQAPSTRTSRQREAVKKRISETHDLNDLAQLYRDEV